jgi:hypothetical protein
MPLSPALLTPHPPLAPPSSHRRHDPHAQHTFGALKMSISNRKKPFPPGLSRTLLRFAKRSPTWTMKCGCNRW